MDWRSQSISKLYFLYIWEITTHYKSCTTHVISTTPGWINCHSYVINTHVHVYIWYTIWNKHRNGWAAGNTHDNMTTLVYFTAWYAKQVHQQHINLEICMVSTIRLSERPAFDNQYCKMSFTQQKSSIRIAAILYYTLPFTTSVMIVIEPSTTSGLLFAQPIHVEYIDNISEVM